MINLTKLEELAKAATQPFIKRFLSKIDFSEGCWNWKASCSGYEGKRYGCFWNGKQIKAHRFSYLAWKGDLDSEKMICHTCDNPICVNPDHLYQGTAKDNAQDALLRGRQSNGEKNKTHCPKGHPYIETNTYLYKGQRQCKTCRDFYRNRTPKKYF